MEAHNYTPDMIYKYHKFLNRARSDRPDYEEATVEAIHAFLVPPYYDEKGHFLIVVDDQIVADILGSRNVGYAIFPPEKINLSLNVLPEYRRKGIGRQLLSIATKHFLDKGMKVAVVDDVHTNCQGAIEFYEKMGFKEAARSYWMEHNLSKAKRIGSHQGAPEGYHIRSLTSQDELEPFRHAVNEAFSDTLNFTPVDQEQFKQRYLNRPTFNLGGFFVAIDEASSSIVGTTASLIEIDDTKKETFGHIKGVGVLRPHRKKGLARLLMMESMSWLSSHEMPVARLGTSNPQALRLYQSLGFKILHGYIRFERAYD